MRNDITPERLAEIRAMADENLMDELLYQYGCHRDDYSNEPAEIRAEIMRRMATR